MSTFGLEATRIAQAQGIPVVADLERLAGPDVLALLPQVDHLIIGVEFGAKVTGEHEPAAMARALRRPDQAACVVTAGAQGCWYTTQESGDELYHVPACVVQVVDTTGCGDVFHGAYAASLARGESVARAVAVATVAAGLKATQPGGRRGIPDRATVERYLAEKTM